MFRPLYGFIKRPKHVANLIIFNYISYSGSFVGMKSYIHIITQIFTTSWTHIPKTVRRDETLPRSGTISSASCVYTRHDSSKETLGIRDERIIVDV